MTNRLSPAQRQQVINDYLNGVITLEYKVSEPSEGKYRVSRRSEAEIRKIKEEYNLDDLEEAANNSTEQGDELPQADEETPPENEDSTEQSEKSEKPPEPVKPKKPFVKSAPKAIPPPPRAKQMNNEVIESLTHTNQEILNHLRLLGEEKARKRQKKEVKREVKHRINKIYKEPDYDEEEDDRERVIIIQKPQYQRRRLNLLTD
jgi:hypothetical protein